MKKGFSQVSFLTTKILKTQRFGLNSRMAKRAEKYCGMKSGIFFETLRKKE